MPRKRGLEVRNRGGAKQFYCLVLINCFPEAVAAYGGSGKRVHLAGEEYAERDFSTLFLVETDFLGYSAKRRFAKLSLRA